MDLEKMPHSHWKHRLLIVLMGVVAGAAPALAEPGLTGEYYDTDNLQTLMTTRVDPMVDFTSWGNAPSGTAVTADNVYSERWTGFVTVPSAGLWTFTTNANDGSRLWVNNTLLIDDWVSHAAIEQSGSLNLNAGAYPIQLEHFQREGGVTIQLYFQGPGVSKTIIPSSALNTTNNAPSANAGPDATVTLPATCGTLSGGAWVPSGRTVTSLIWTQESGPNTANLSGANTAELTACGVIEGVYVFRLTVTDSAGDTAFDAASIFVSPSGSTVYVDSTGGNDSNSCKSPTSACKTIQRGANVVRGGDMMIVKPGKYYELPQFQSLGSSASQPVWIKAEPAGSVTISGAWKEAEAGQVSWDDGADGVTGDGVYSASHQDALFGAYDGKYLFRFQTVSDLRNANAGGINVVPYGIAMANGRVHVRLPGNVNPNGKSILLSTPTFGQTGKVDLVKITGSPYVIFDGFKIEGGGTYCMSFDQASVGPTLRNIIFSYCRYGAQLPDNSLVEWSEYVWPGLYDFSEDVRQLNGGTIRTFDLIKQYHSSLWLSGGIAEAYQSYSSRNNEFRYNYMHETFDGELLGEFEYSESHHNVYQHNYDNHIQMESTAGFGSRELRLHDNLFLASAKPPLSHQESSLVGPQYVYRNIVYGFDEHGWNTWALIKSDVSSSSQKIYYYHNVLWGRNTELFWDENRRDMFEFRNNIIIFNDLKNNPSSSSFDSDFNLLINNQDESWVRGSNGLYLGTNPDTVGFVDVNGLNFVIQPGSPAENQGTWLPGFNDGAAGGADIGAFEAGTVLGPEWPRPMRTVFTTDPPERWNGSVGDPDTEPPSAVQNLRRGDVLIIP